MMNSLSSVIRSIDELDTDVQSNLISAIPDIMSYSVKTPSASVLFQKAIQVLKPAAADLFKSVLRSVACEYVKSILHL